MAWTEFIDTHAEGKWQVESYTHVYIEMPKAQAIVEFKAMLGVDPTGKADGMPLYSIFQSDDLAEVTAFARGCRWDSETKRYIDEDAGNSLVQYMTLEEYVDREDVCVIYAE